MIKNRDSKLAIKLCKEICLSFVEEAKKQYEKEEKFSKFYLTQFRTEEYRKNNLEKINRLKDKIDKIEEDIFNYQFDANSGTVTYPDGKRVLLLPGTTEEQVEIDHTRKGIQKLFAELNIKTEIFDYILLYTLEKYSDKYFYTMRIQDETNREQVTCKVDERISLDIRKFTVDLEKTDKIILDHMKEELFKVNSEKPFSLTKDELIKSTFENMKKFSRITFNENKKDIETIDRLSHKTRELLANRLNFDAEIEYVENGKDDFYYKNSEDEIHRILGQHLDNYLINCLEENGKEALDLKRIKDLLSVNPKVVNILRSIVHETKWYIDQNLESSRDIYFYLSATMNPDEIANNISEKTGEIDKIRENNRKNIVTALEVLEKYLGIEKEFNYENLNRRENLSQGKSL